MIWSNEKQKQLQQDIEALIDWLSQFGAVSNNGVSRLVYSKEWLNAQLAIQSRSMENGFSSSFDEVGNLFVTLEGIEDEVILTGSHIDTVENGGKYDGSYGILAGYLALSFLKKHYGQSKKTLQLVSFCEEEGSRFPLTFWGSTCMTKDRTDFPFTTKDKKGITLEQAMKVAGFPPENIHTMRKKEKIDAFIELHIEQGMRLESSGHSIGIVENIAGIYRFTVTLEGEANHSGTTPMHLRKDALYSSALLIQWLTETAERYGDPLVVTVGQILAEPNTPNVIPGKVTFTIDLRHPKKQVLDQFRDEMEYKFRQFSLEKGVELNITQWLDSSPVEMDRQLVNLSSDICQTQQLPFRFMTSGAGHDSQILAQHYPTLLLFVPSHKGISHSPKEYTFPEDLTNGVKVLIELLYKLAY